MRSTTRDKQGTVESLAYDEQSLRRLRHCDVSGLQELMEDYEALGDELEDIEPATVRMDPPRAA